MEASGPETDALKELDLTHWLRRQICSFFPLNHFSWLLSLKCNMAADTPVMLWCICDQSCLQLLVTSQQKMDDGN